MESEISKYHLQMYNKMFTVGGNVTINEQKKIQKA